MDRELPPDDVAASLRTQKAATSLYISRIKVYPKAVTGAVRRAKWAILVVLLTVYYVTPWIRWNRGPGQPDQAILLDLDARRGYIFNIEIWPQEVYFLTGLLILGAIGLFLATSLFGRLWCGYACPQTVWTDLFLLVERLIEGDRAERMRLDKAPMSADKALRKTAKHAVWLAIAAATGGAWIFYYVDAPTTLVKILTLRASYEVYFFVGLFTATTYALAGWAREQVCTYMCPWPRFQAAMLDEHSLIVAYRAWRGEPRGKHKAGASWDGRGDCVDCKLCVAVCPTGIDIRDGQQIECIGCGLCVDACNQTMDKVGRPRGLVAWDTLVNQQAQERKTPPQRWRPLRPRTAIYAGVLLVVAAVMLGAFLMRADTEMTAQRDRSPNFVRLSDGQIRNAYTVKILNKGREDRLFALSVAGLPGAALAVAGHDATPAANSVPLPVKHGAVGAFRVFVTVPAGAAPRGSATIEFVAQGPDRRRAAGHDAVFVGPAH